MSTSLERLGYHDSGMPEWDYKDRPDAFWNVPIEESSARLAALMERHQPQVVITYDEFGGYNHPDHVQANRITLAAIERTGIPAKLYFTARRWSDFERLRDAHDRTRCRRRPAPTDRPGAPPADGGSRGADHDDGRHHVGCRAASATRCERTPANWPRRWFAKMPESMFDEVFGVESFIREQDRTAAPLPEIDLFAGLR